MSDRLIGAVLAGGESRRFGSPKAHARLHGRPLWRLAADRLRAVCPRVVVAANDPGAAPDAQVEPDVQVEPDAQLILVRDRTPGLGPLAGVGAALTLAAEAGMDGVLALAVDMPWVPEAALRRLAEAFGGGPAGKTRPCAARSGAPWGFEPLCAVYPTDALGALETALTTGDRQAGAFARSIGVVPVECGAPPEAFRSVNVPADLPPPVVAVVGNKNSGKTTLAVALIAELGRRGRRVMSVKHGHGFRLDTPGTDSWRHRHEGRAERVLLAGPRDFALIGEWGPKSDSGREDCTDGPASRTLDLDLLTSRWLAGAEVVVAEGFRRAAVPKIQVHRSAAQPEPAFGPEEARAAGVLAVVTDRTEPAWPVPVLDPEAPELAARLADVVEEALL